MVLSFTRVLPLPWWIGAAVTGAGATIFLYEKITGNTFGNPADDEPDRVIPVGVVDSCGCSSGEQTVLRYQPWLGKPRVSKVPCSTALASVASNPRRFSVLGCELA